MDRSVKIAYQHMNKTGYRYLWDQYNLTDLITDGHDVNKVDSNALARALWQECITELQTMRVHSDMSQKAWSDKLEQLLTRAGMKNDNLKEMLAEQVAGSFITYLTEKESL